MNDFTVWQEMGDNLTEERFTRPTLPHLSVAELLPHIVFDLFRDNVPIGVSSLSGSVSTQILTPPQFRVRLLVTQLHIALDMQGSLSFAARGSRNHRNASCLRAWASLNTLMSSTNSSGVTSGR